MRKSCELNILCWPCTVQIVKRVSVSADERTAPIPPVEFDLSTNALKHSHAACTGAVHDIPMNVTFAEVLQCVSKCVQCFASRTVERLQYAANFLNTILNSETDVR